MAMPITVREAADLLGMEPSRLSVWICRNARRLSCVVRLGSIYAVDRADLPELTDALERAGMIRAGGRALVAPPPHTHPTENSS